MDIELLIATLVFIVPMCFTPGPNNVLCAAHGSQHGFRDTLPLIAGMAIGWSALGLFVGGSVLLGLLAIMSVRSAGKKKTKKELAA